MSGNVAIHIDDVPSMLRIVARAASADGRTHCCLSAAAELCRFFNSTCFVWLDIVPQRGGWKVIDFFDDGFNSRQQRNAVVQAIKHPMLQDPFLVSALRRRVLANVPCAAFTCGDLLTPRLARNSAFCRQKNEAWFSDCLISVATVNVPAAPRISGLLFFRAASIEAPFALREKTLIQLCHPALADICASRLQKRPEHAAALSPRLRETFRHLATGRSEKLIAKRMKLSYHTVHDYVKSLYSHFGVSSRRDLLERWSVAGHALKS